MELAAFIGIPFSEFWEMSPFELSIAVKGYNKRKEFENEDYKAKFEMEQKQSIYQAYLISRWVWAKRIDIKKVLNIKDEPKKDEPKKGKKAMTDDEMWQQVRRLNKLFGGEEID